MPIPKPRVTPYGASYGEFKGDILQDHEPPGDIDSGKLNKNTIIDGVEFTKFEETVKDYVLGHLGHGVVRVELTPFQLKLAIDEAVTKLDYHAPQWTTQFAVFDASAEQNLYEIPGFILNNLTYVVYKKTLLTIQSQAGTLEFDYFIRYFQDNHLFQNFNVGEFLLLQQHLEQLRKILSQEGSWDIINNKFLQINPRPVVTPQEVILEYRALDSDTIHPAYRNWIQRYALAVAKGILGKIRNKYKTLPGPGGGARLDGEELVQESKEEKVLLMEELMTEIEEMPYFTLF